jgi:hypothetical protein
MAKLILSVEIDPNIKINEDTGRAEMWVYHRGVRKGDIVISPDLDNIRVSRELKHIEFKVLELLGVSD